MSREAKRRWFQFHLSTAVVGMLVFGVFMAKNLSVYSLTYDSGPGKHGEYSQRDEIGWPESFYFERTVIASAPTEERLSYPLPRPRTISVNKLFRANVHRGLYYGGLIVDLSTAVCLLLLTGGTVEFLFRRREARKP